MTPHEFHVQELKNLKGKPFKDKIEHIVTYYWIPIVAIIVVLTILIIGISSAVNRKETVLQGYMLDAAEQTGAAETFAEDLSAHLGLTEKQQIVLNASFRSYNDAMTSSLETISVHVAAAEVDFLACNASVCTKMLSLGLGGDLAIHFDENQIAKLSPYLVYCERSALEQEDTAAVLELGSKDAMQDPVPVAIQLPADSRMNQAYSFDGDTAYIIVVPNAPRAAAVWNFLTFLLPQLQ